jgi:TRAP-type C4-dicarboxylate transport system substrate-binding protein
MKQKKSITLFGSIGLILVVLLTSGSYVPAYANPATVSKPIQLKWVSFRPSTHKGVISIRKLFVDPINEQAKGQLAIDWKGGPDVMAPRDIGLAVKNGIIDIGSIYVGAYEALVPGVGAAILTQLTPEEERKPGGAYDFLQSLHEKAGLYYLGRAEPMKQPFFYTWLRDKRLETKEDFVGVKIGSATAARAAVEGWGATVVTVSIPENYSALERGLVKGVAGQPLRGAVGFGWYERTKYVIDHPYYQSSVVLIMNLNTWKRLPANLQKLITKCMIQGEKDSMVEQGETEIALRKKISDSGVEFYKLSPDVADWYIKTAYDSAWQYQQKRFPEVTPKLKELLSK